MTETYTVDDGDKLSSITQGSTTVKSYTYDGRVTSIVYPSSATNSFTYNGLDTRVGKVDSAGTAAYRRDGADVTNSVLSDGSAVYTPGVSQRRAGATTYDLSDRLGTSTLQTSNATTVTGSRSYDAFGVLLASTGAPLGPFGFAGGTGYQEDSDSALKLVGHRYYDSSTGRFLTRDKAKDGRNWYSYCEGNPLRGLDPTGFYDVVTDFMTGFGDTIWPFPQDPVQDLITGGKPVLKWVREKLGCDGVDEGGPAYGAGQTTGAVFNEAIMLIDPEKGLTTETGCFTAGTLVRMADGSARPIEKVGVGDRVLTRSQNGDDAAPVESGTVT